MTIEEWAKDFKSYVNALDMPRDDYNGIIEYIDDAIDLLKEQEPVKPRVDADGTFNCGNCGEPVGFDEHPFTCKAPEIAMKFCCGCGKPVKWK